MHNGEDPENTEKSGQSAGDTSHQTDIPHPGRFFHAFAQLLRWRMFASFFWRSFLDVYLTPYAWHLFAFAVKAKTPYDIEGLKSDFSNFGCFFNVVGNFDYKVIVGVFEKRAQP